MPQKNSTQIARELLNSTSYLSKWEKDFLKNIRSQKGFATRRQNEVLWKIAKRAHLSIYTTPAEKQPESKTFARFKELENVAARMRPADQQFYRQQLRDYRKNGSGSLNAYRIAALYQKYLAIDAENDENEAKTEP